MMIPFCLHLRSCSREGGRRSSSVSVITHTHTHTHRRLSCLLNVLLLLLLFFSCRPADTSTQDFDLKDLIILPPPDLYADFTDE